MLCRRSAHGIQGYVKIAGRCSFQEWASCFRPSGSIPVPNQEVGQSLSGPECHPRLNMKQTRMNFHKTDDVAVEPWWVTILVCVAFAAIIALALIAQSYLIRPAKCLVVLH